MILTASLILKFVLPLFFIALVFRKFRAEWDKKDIIRAVLFVLLFAVVANVAANRLPSLTDTVTLTALGEKQENAKAAEVLLTGYTVDGKEYSAGKSLQILKGKWFWSGENYLWRIETDPRQPKGTTRSITVKIPVGWDRSLNFISDIWRGKVSVSFNGNEQVFDAFSENYKISPVSIGRSQTTSLILNQCLRLSVYTVILFALTACAVALLSYIKRQPESAKIWWQKNNSRVLYASIATAAFCFMVQFSGDPSFWLDELYQVQFVKDSFVDVVRYSLVLREATPPFFGLFAWVWYHIVPFGEEWLLLISIIPVLFTVYIMGLIGEKLGEKYCGFLAAVMLAFSTTVWNFAAFEFRAYSFVILLSTLALYCHIQKAYNKEQKNWMIAYSISLACLAITHYFGMLLCGMFFLADLYLYFLKKISWKSVFSYILLGVVALTWLCLLYMHIRPGSVVSWYGVPYLKSILNLLKFLSGNYPFSFYLFLLGVVCVLAYLYPKKSREISWAEIYQRISLGIVTGVILLMYVYGHYLYPKLTLWTNRYFIILIPFVVLLSAFGVVRLLSVKENAIFRRIAALLITIVLAINCVSVGATQGVIKEAYREAANWLYTQSNTIFDPKTITITTSNVYDAWAEYYISRKGRRDQIHVIKQGQIAEKDLLSYNRVYLQYSHTRLSKPLQSALNKHYTLEQDLPKIQMKVYVKK